MYTEDTIVAPATPAGQGAVAIVRLSGPRAIEIARRLWRPRHRATITPRKLYLGDICDPQTNTAFDRGLCVLMPAPNSMTGEDVAELQCHGGVYLVRRIIGFAIAQGARMAEPGEFSRRAFLNGRIDLTEAEAIADLVSARGEGSLKQALAQLNGALAVKIETLRQKITGLRAHLEVEIDFSDEDIQLPSRELIAAEIELLSRDLAILHDSFARGRIIREGARAAIVGKPNAGKSSVLNLLLGAERAIVTPIPGTTRDVIEDSIQLGLYPLVLQDTAGIRKSIDPVERIGIDRTVSHMGQADLVIAVFDSSRPLESEDLEVISLSAGKSGIALLNKRDLPQVLGASDLISHGLKLPLMDFSAITADRVGDLRERLTVAVESLLGEAAPGEIAISRERHRDALARALESLAAARESALAGMPPEIVAVDVGMAAEALALITGIVSGEDVLDAVFREFCIGK